MYERYIKAFDECCTKATLIWPQFRKPTLVFDLYGQAAGQANYGKNLVRLNHTYCLTEFSDMIADTIPHEVAHILAFQRYGTRIAPHGGEWFAMYGALTGNTPKRCHDYENVKVAARRAETELSKMAEKMLRELGD